MGAHELSRRARALIGLWLATALALPAVATAKTSFIPIPEIITDPNEGNTFGLLGVVLFLDDQDEIQYMLAPDATYNHTKGFFPTFRFFGYPTPTRRYSIVIGKSTTVDEDYELEFVDRGFWEGRAFVLASFLHERDSTERFFGFGNNSTEAPKGTNPLTGDPIAGESNYTINDTVAQATPGVWLLPHVSLSYRMRIRRFSPERGQVDTVPFLFTSYPDVRRRDLASGVYWAHQVALTYDSRDSIDIPTRGSYANLYTEAADRTLGSTTSFVKFGSEWRRFIPLRKGNPILALRLLLDYTSGSGDTPLQERSSLGGRRALRGFGSDRFTEFNRSLGAAELRTRVWQRKLFGVNMEVEVAPFTEVGKVYPHVTDSPLNQMHFVYGVGFRGVVRPQIVGFVDIGHGSDGTVVFTGVNYPF
jgi:outer membrane protein assembly factor BamA